MSSYSNSSDTQKERHLDYRGKKTSGINRTVMSPRQQLCVLYVCIPYVCCAVKISVPSTWHKVIYESSLCISFASSPKTAETPPSFPWKNRGPSKFLDLTHVIINVDCSGPRVLPIPIFSPRQRPFKKRGKNKQTKNKLKKRNLRLEQALER